MRLWYILITVLIWAACPAFPRPAVITAGEHAGFTRVVIQFGAPIDWHLGREPQGYRLRIVPKAPTYDLKNVFNLIGKTRLTAAAVDPETGDLRLNLSCRCFAMPYEERPGVVVVDLRDGDAPAGSSFELPLDKPAVAHISADIDSAQHYPQPTFNWSIWSLPTAVSLPVAPDPNPQLPPLNPSLNPLRSSLIQDLSRGASQGLVDMVVPDQTAPPPTDGKALPPQIEIGVQDHLITRQKDRPGPALAAQGGACWSDDQLDIAAWAGQQPVAAQMGPQRKGLIAEFDTPDPVAVTRAVRFDLFLGFGAEARSLIRTFSPDNPDAALWSSMARIMDTAPDPTPAFVGMEDCPTAAALWATLSRPHTLPRSPLAKAAVLRGFSALPPHLRQLLGPDLVDRFLQANDMTLATALFDAILRDPSVQSPAIVIMQSKMNQALGKTDRAISKISDLAKSPGPSAAEGLATLIEEEAPLGHPITFAQVQALEAYLLERRGGPDAPRFQRALILARAASGDFDSAFKNLDSAPDIGAKVWQLLTRTGSNTAFLSHASLLGSDPIPQAAKALAIQIADRMLGLGLPDQAALWIAQATQTPSQLVARVKLAQGDSQGALNQLQSDTSDSASQLRAQAYQALGNPRQAADLYAKLGRPQDHWQALRQAGDWVGLAKHGPAPWKVVAELAINSAPLLDATSGPLAHDTSLLARSVATRDAILDLLEQTKIPVSASQ